MNIIIYNGNLEPPHFVNLLANKLGEKEHSVFLAGTANYFFRKKKKKLVLISTDSNNFYLMMIHLIFNGWRLFFSKPQLFFKFIKLLFKSEKSVRIRIKQFLIWSKLIFIKADIVHIQWASHIILFEEILEEHLFKTVISLRGRLLNVSPYIDADLKELYIRNFPKVDAIHAVSKDILSNLSKLGIDAKKSRIIYSGVDLKNIPLKEIYDNSGILEVLSIGRFNWIKGYNYALYAVKELLLKNINVHYTIIANGENEEIIYLIEELELQKNVTIVSELSHIEVLNKMISSDLLLLPSVSEGLANVVLEAMAVGLPVLSSNCGGMKEVITPHENGWLFENRNPENMAFVIEEILKMDNKSIEKMAINGKEYINKNHNLEQMCDQMIELYHEL
ncbi:glycosyltransferase family 4 protein [Lutibacter sp.]|uniref:glycosyltransferase family 4 protein n=1 Tax=Lutibacter sp. TaxID=1925666 RepID=UPI0027347F7E|nr:glycosyltransferase family 4 protein [Lutibacter sp.]MDP3312588.1 glycosyltransferase family 4 protein [Lutibacter sp.]